MSLTVVYCDSMEVSLDVGPDIANITDQLVQMAHKAGVENGSLHASVIGSTGSLTTIEYEPGVVEDLRRAITRLAPPDMEYEHEKAWHDGNGHSHVQAALLGPSVAIPVRNGVLALGTWQQVVLINHDNRPRQRRVEVTVIGKKRRPQEVAG
ncbi:MAG: YjbQ family protein [Deltaproteobacteria bacterium]|nr:YjbQ family protein [Deltaproteobacteria bacterium]MBW1793438.1 YjbQ family protein [Deltaproteobacteria bacterium]MBW2329365.1 YjbQ family protein [Deltaproteobacteria bacterium]